jgi:hypothetical protein
MLTDAGRAMSHCFIAALRAEAKLEPLMKDSLDV